MSMRLFLGITGLVIAIIAFVGILYLNSQRYSILSADLSLCVQGKVEQQSKIQDYRLEIERLRTDLKEAKALLRECGVDDMTVQRPQQHHQQLRECPPCPAPVPNPIPVPVPVPNPIPVPVPVPASSSSSSQAGFSHLEHPKCWKNTPLYLPGFNCTACWNGMPNQWPWEMEGHICNYLSLGGCCRYRHLLGLNFEHAPQLGWGDLMMLDFAFTGHPSLKNIVEFGTYLGITSLHLASMANLRGGQFISFDIGEHRHNFVADAWRRNPNMKIYFTDLLKTPSDERVIEAAKMDDTFYFFDNGDKTWECNHFMEDLAKTNSAFCTHDWDIEVALNGIQESLTKYGFVPFAFEHGEMLGSHVRCFTKKK